MSAGLVVALLLAWSTPAVARGPLPPIPGDPDPAALFPGERRRAIRAGEGDVAGPDASDRAMFDLARLYLMIPEPPGRVGRPAFEAELEEPESLFCGMSDPPVVPETRGRARARDDDRALELLGELLRRFPASPLAAEAQLLTGAVHYARGDWLQALVAYRHAATLGGPTAAAATFRLAWCHAKLGDWDAALAVARSARPLAAPGYDRVILDALAGFYRDAGRVDEGVAWFRGIGDSWHADWLRGQGPARSRSRSRAGRAPD